MTAETTARPWYAISAFADEIHPDIQIQMDVLSDCKVRFVTLRTAFQKNVLDLEEFQRKKLKTEFYNRKFRFSCLGSPIGKVSVGDPFEKEQERFRKALDVAGFFECRTIRIFSFYLPEKADPAAHRDEIVKRMKWFADQAKAAGIYLLLENESGLYGDAPERCRDLIEAAASPHLVAAFDFANFVRDGFDTLKAWDVLKKHVKEFHIKDHNRAENRVVPAGKGDGRVAEILKDARAVGFRGYLTLEPHLKAVGQFQGYSGPEMFVAAVEALKSILAGIG
ncbi:MAG: sugar phosphate isomerase/epimerase [Planctomycetota bacterium]|nr:sugar phosphate isomerase/epimerase [Planctomycetota bacterium]